MKGPLRTLKVSILGLLCFQMAMLAFAGETGSILPIVTNSPGVFQIGPIRIAKTENSITFPAALNLREGPMEYLLVTDSGKLHESILRTSVAPYLIHVAFLLLEDAQQLPPPAAKASGGQASSGPLKNPSKENLPGKGVTIEVTWDEKGAVVRRNAEELVYNIETRLPMKKPRWVYNGSRVSNGVFLAQEEGSIISLITDISALVNSETEGHDNDKIWTVNTNGLPPVNVPLRVTIRRQPAATRQ